MILRCCHAKSAGKRQRDHDEAVAEPQVESPRQSRSRRCAKKIWREQGSNAARTKCAACDGTLRLLSRFIANES
jgi:hypothetical protein